jgi:hypothetical protein
MKLSQNRKWIMRAFIVIVIAILIFTFKSDHTRNLNRFSNNLFKYPLPPVTVVLETEKFGGKNWVDGGGSGGYWNVVAIMKLSTKLSRDEIIEYYRNVRFPYSKTSQPQMVEPEIYFDDDAQKVVCKEGFYYRSDEDSIKFVSSYDNGKSKKDKKETVFILQIIDGYDYLFNID